MKPLEPTLRKRSPGSDWCLDVRLQQGTLKEREEEARRQSITEVWETSSRRLDGPGPRRSR